MEKLNKRLSQYKSRCKSKGIKFELSDDYAKSLMTDTCFMCGEKGTENKPLGIDRFFHSDHYHKANVAPCCWNCNRAKNNLSFPKFITWFKKFNPNFDGHKKIVSKYYSYLSTLEAESRYL